MIMYIAFIVVYFNPRLTQPLFGQAIAAALLLAGVWWVTSWLQQLNPYRYTPHIRKPQRPLVVDYRSVMLAFSGLLVDRMAEVMIFHL